MALNRKANLIVDNSPGKGNKNVPVNSMDQLIDSPVSWVLTHYLSGAQPRDENRRLN